MLTSNNFSSCSTNDENIFQCNQHAVNIYEKLQKLYEEENLFDIILIAGRDCIEIPAHAIVLSGLSEYFWEILHDNATILEGNKVILEEIEAPSLESIVDYMYSGAIELNYEDIETLLRNAVFLKMKNLVNGCCDFIEKNLDVSDCLHWMHLAKELKLSGLQEKLFNLFYANFEKVTNQSEFLKLNEVELKDLLFKDNPHAHLEEQVFLSLMAWIEYEEANRQNLLLELLSMVRYQYLTAKFIIENRTIKNAELVHQWLLYHLSPESRTIEQQNFTSSELEPNKELNFPEKVREFGAIRLNDRNEAEIFCRDETSEKWYVAKRSRPLLTNNSFSSMIVIDEKLFVVGGIDVNGRVKNCVQYIDIKTLKLTKLPPMQTGRLRSRLANLNGDLCVFGGFEDYNFRKFIDSVEILNLSTHRWSYLNPPCDCEPDKRHKIVGYNGILYIFDFRYGSVECFDASSYKWTSKKLPIDDNPEDFHMVAVGNFVYAIFCTGKDLPHGQFHKMKIKCFDLSNSTWSKVAKLSEETSFVEMVTSVENKFLIYKTNGDIVEYNIDNNIFTDHGNLNLKNGCILPFTI